MAAAAPRANLYELYSTSSAKENGQICLDDTSLAIDSEALLTFSEWEFVGRSVENVNQLLRLKATREQMEMTVDELNKQGAILGRIQFSVRTIEKNTLKSLFNKGQQFRIYLEHKIIEDAAASPLPTLISSKLPLLERSSSHLSIAASHAASEVDPQSLLTPAIATSAEPPLFPNSVIGPQPSLDHSDAGARLGAASPQGRPTSPHGIRAPGQTGYGPDFEHIMNKPFFISLPEQIAKDQRRAYIDNLLLDKPDGSYIVRYSGGYVVISLQYKRRICHVRVDYKNGAYYLAARQPFLSFADLLANYHLNIIDDKTIPIPLREPVLASNMGPGLEVTDDGYLQSLVSFTDRM